jgi:hypothetical protein
MVSPPTRPFCCKPCKPRGLRGRFAPARNGTRRCSGAWEYSQYRVGVLRVPRGCTPSTAWVYSGVPRGNVPLGGPPLGRHASWPLRRCSGVLYEDDSIQFGIKSAFNGDGPASLCCSGPKPLCCSGRGVGVRLALVEYWVLQGAIRTTGYSTGRAGLCARAGAQGTVSVYVGNKGSADLVGCTLVTRCPPGTHPAARRRRAKACCSDGMPRSVRQGML